MPRSRVTIRDVAARAGVSHQTVSRVINDHERVSADTRARVEAAIVELDYQPNAIARSMARGRTSMLACIAPNLTDYTFAAIIDGAERAARRRDYFLVAAAAPDANLFSALVDQLVTSRRVEGLIVLNPYADGRFHHIPDDFPVVLAGARPREDALASVALDDVSAGREATEHLIQAGHRRIALVTGPMVEDCSQDRLSGYRQALSAAAIPFDDSLIMAGDWSASSGYRAFERLVQRGVLPTAVFAQNDQMAAGVMRAAAEMDLRVPDQLSVIGVDDIPMAAFLSPPLTTLRQDFGQIGQKATGLLLDAIKDAGSPARHLLLPADFIKRKSTRPANAA